MNSGSENTDNNYTYINDLVDLMDQVPEDSIISRTVYRDEQLRAILFGFAAQQELSEHTAARPAMIHFLKGEVSVTIGDRTFQAKAGSWLHMPAHLPHSIVASEPAVLLLLLV